MPDRPTDQVGVLLLATVPRLEHDSAVVLAAVNRFSCGSATLQVAIELVDEPYELPFVVEGSDHLMTAFVPVRIVGVPVHHLAPDVVIVRVNGAMPSVCAVAHCHRLKA
jgi:hypothetical protein